jgi:hypothetical protein
MLPQSHVQRAQRHQSTQSHCSRDAAAYDEDVPGREGSPPGGLGRRNHPQVLLQWACAVKGQPRGPRLILHTIAALLCVP